MKTDRYTKVVLSVIAICLTLIVLRDITLVPNAQAESQSVSPVVDVRIVAIEPDTYRHWKPITVKVAGRHK